MIQRFVIPVVLAAAAMCLLAACASSDSGAVTEQPAATVPGQRVSSEGAVTPNMSTGGPGASIGW